MTLYSLFRVGLFHWIESNKVAEQSWLEGEEISRNAESEMERWIVETGGNGAPVLLHF